MRIIPVKLPHREASIPCLVDDSDFPKVEGFKWHITNGYASTNRSGRNGTRSMHRMLMGYGGDKSLLIDHKNGNRLDNRRENLRFCTLRENEINAGVRKTNKLGVKGVSKEGNRFRVHCSIVPGVHSAHIGSYPTLEEAKAAYEEAAKKAHGDFFHVETKEPKSIKSVRKDV